MSHNHGVTSDSDATKRRRGYSSARGMRAQLAIRVAVALTSLLGLACSVSISSNGVRLSVATHQMPSTDTLGGN